MITTRFYSAVPCGRNHDGRIVLDCEQAIKCESAERAVQVAALLARMPDPGTRRRRLPSRGGGRVFRSGREKP
jgi:hypothetical protein